MKDITAFSKTGLRFLRHFIRYDPEAHSAADINGRRRFYTICRRRFSPRLVALTVILILFRKIVVLLVLAFVAFHYGRAQDTAAPQPTYLLRRLSITGPTGVTGIPAGTEVTVIATHGSSVTAKVRDQQFEISSDQLTYDATLGHALAQQESASASGHLRGPGDQRTLRITTWHLQWFPHGRPHDVGLEEQAKNISAVADVLRKIGPDIILLQDVRDYDACARLAEAIAPGMYKVAICSAFQDKRQDAILAKEYAQAAWSEPWEAAKDVTPPRGLTFAWFKIRNIDMGVCCFDLKASGGLDQLSRAKNIRKREVSATQLVQHINTVIRPAIPSLQSLVVGGDFHTNSLVGDGIRGSSSTLVEATHRIFTKAGFRNCIETLPRAPNLNLLPSPQGYADTIREGLLSNNLSFGTPFIIPSTASIGSPLTCDFRPSGELR